MIAQGGWQVLDRARRASFLGIATAVSLLLMQNPAMAAASAEKITQVIGKAKILAPGTQLKVRVQGEQASISTFRNERADDKDSKIDALLIGKTIFDMPGSGITNVVVYFYSTKAASEYKAVTIRTGDVKSFDAGQMSQDELLSSIEIKSGKVQDAATAIESRMMLSAAARRDFQTVDRGEEIEVSCKMPPLSDDEYKFEAYRIASTALEVAGEGASAKRVKVTFYDPTEKGKYKQVTISLNNMQSIQRQVAAAFNSMQLNAGVSKLSARDAEPSEGPLLTERTALLARIQGLEDKGVGVAPFVQAYQGLDAKVGQIEAAELQKEVARLSENLKEQELLYEKAKTLKFSKPETKVEAKPGRDLSGTKEPKAKSAISKWALGYFPLLASDICRDPDAYLAECKRRFDQEAAQNKKPKYDQDPRSAHALMWFALVLRENNFNEDAQRYENEARSQAARFAHK